MDSAIPNVCLYVWASYFRYFFTQKKNAANLNKRILYLDKKQVREILLKNFLLNKKETSFFSTKKRKKKKSFEFHSFMQKFFLSESEKNWIYFSKLLTSEDLTYWIWILIEQVIYAHRSNRCRFFFTSIIAMMLTFSSR